MCTLIKPKIGYFTKKDEKSVEQLSSHELLLDLNNEPHEFKSDPQRMSTGLGV